MKTEAEIREWHNELEKDLAEDMVSVEQAIGTNAAMLALRWVLNDPKGTQQ